MNPNLSGILALLIFSIGTLQVAFLRHIPSFELGAIGLALGFVFLSGWEIRRGKNLMQEWRRPLPDYIIVMMGAGLYAVLLFFAFAKIPPFEANVLNYLWPLLLVIFSHLLHKQPWKLYQLLGIFTGFAGAVLVFRPAAGEAVFENFGTGHVLAILAAVSWAFYSAKAYGRTYPASLLAPCMLITAFVCLILHLMFEETVWPGVDSLLLILFWSVCRLSYALWDYGIRNGDKLLLASLSYFVPLISVLLFILFGFEPASANVAWGGVLIIAGCLLANTGNITKFLKSGRAS